jgi:hypothetical protein
VSAWLLALALSVGLVALSYAPALRDGGRVWLPALLRGVGALLLAAAAFDAPAGRARVATPHGRTRRVGELDPGRRARDARRRARLGPRCRPDAPLLAGDSLRSGDPALAGRDAASRVVDAVERASASGAPWSSSPTASPTTPPHSPGAPRIARRRHPTRPRARRRTRRRGRAAGGGHSRHGRCDRDRGATRPAAGAGEVTVLVGSRALATVPVPAIAPFGSGGPACACR